MRSLIILFIQVSVVVFFLATMAVGKATIKKSTTDVANLEKAYIEDRCTSIAVGRKASIDDTVMTTHTSDCADCDWRLNKVPARDWAPGSMRPIYKLKVTYICMHLHNIIHSNCPFQPI